MRLYPFAAGAASLVLGAVVLWQVVESSTDLGDVPAYSPRPSPSASVRDVTVDPGMSPREIGNRLEDAGVITSATQFTVLVSLLGYDGILQAGDYEFDLGTPALTAVYRIRQGQTSTRSITVTEGWRLEEVADALDKLGIPRDEFLTEAKARNFARSAARPDGYDFLPGTGRNVSLEGYLYPATYPVRKTDTPESILGKMLKAFQDNVTSDISQAAQSAGLDLQDVITLASIIERESVVPDERPIIAQVLLSRLRQGIPLEADPTVQYALGQDADSVSQSGYWKKDLSRADLEIDSPYNTYLNRGLPPGPICNPRLDSIEAVVHPATTNYLYFVAKGDGSHAFATTLQEHLDNIKKYQGGQ